MNKMLKNATILWTGGKDSSLALYEAKKLGYDIKSLVTFIPCKIEFLAHPLSFMKYQSEALQLPHYTMEVNDPFKESYEKAKNYHYEDLEETGREILSIPPYGYALIKSLERFKCSKGIIAIFGQTSALPRKGLRLNHSPSIDPNFSGYLEMGLENLLDKPREIQYRDTIGKVLFFNIHDTYPISDIKGTISEKDYKRRETLEKPESLK